MGLTHERTITGPAFQKAAGSKLVAVMRRNPELAKDFAMRHQVPKVYSSVRLSLLRLVHEYECSDRPSGDLASG
jgi:hypothetical protein